MDEENRLARTVEGAVKAIISAITLRPVFKRVFTFRTAIVVAVAGQTWYLLNRISSLVASQDLLELFDLSDYHIFSNTINVVTDVAMIAVLFLLSRLLTVHREDAGERALSLALKNGILSDYEFKKKRLELQREAILRSIKSLANSGILPAAKSEELCGEIERSYKRKIMQEALNQARAVGAIDEETYKARDRELS